MKITKSLPTILMCVLVSAALFFAACSKQPDEKIDKKTSDKVVEKNPFFSAYNTPFNVPPFDKIKTEHYMPAFKEGMKKDKEDIDAIISNQEAPTFANTIGALDKSGLLLSEVGSVFFNLKSAKTSPELRKVAKEVIPMLTQHSDDISLNEKLFKKIEAVYEQKDTLKLSPEETTVLDEYYKGFVRDGANLNAEQKDKLRAINKELSLCTLSFGDNILAETNSFKLIIEKKEDLDGLPPTVIAGGAEAAEEANLKGKWLYTIHKPSMIPFLKFSSKRELREKIFKAYINKGDHNDKLDNKKNIARIVQLRLEKAKLLGFKTYAHFVLDNNMAKIPENVNKLLMQVWKPALVAAKREVKALQTIIDKEGGKFKLQPWDWWYYAEKLKKEKYDLDDSIVKPYFKLENVRNGAFSVANKLWGINFKEVKDMPKPHPDATAFQVTEADGTHIGILYVDYFPRASKRGGAWMNSYRKQYTIAGKHVPPVITNVGNFAKPVGDIPSLLSLDNTETLFHEFGHALHGLLSNCKYKSLSGSDVARDFVELPSQIMENWGEHPDVMKMYFKHYKTGETMPQELIDKITTARKFNQGFVTTELMAASLLDMDWHTLENTENLDVHKFEKDSLDKIGLIPEIVSRYKSTFFSHIFSGGYASGYYSYMWAEVLDADAFEAFKENGIFDQKTAKAFRDHILSKGGTEDPMVLYKRFRGKEPGIKPLLLRRGLIKE